VSLCACDIDVHLSLSLLIFVFILCAFRLHLLVSFILCVSLESLCSYGSVHLLYHRLEPLIVPSPSPFSFRVYRATPVDCGDQLLNVTSNTCVKSNPTAKAVSFMTKVKVSA
jgi:hypothetical protein